MQKITAALGTGLILAAIYTLLVAVRLVPAYHNTIEFKLDAAFNYRMTDAVARAGDVPALDGLSTYPDGKNIKAFLPTGMYHLAALFHRLVQSVAPMPLARALPLFCAGAGALIAIPLYLIAVEIYRRRVIGYLVALLGGIIPAYLNRSVAYWYRYETVATPLVFLSLFFFIRIFTARTPRQARMAALWCAGSLVGALYIWRLAVLFLAVYGIVVIYLWLTRRDFSRQWWTAAGMILLVCLCLAWAVPGFGLHNPASQYGTFPRAAVEIMLHHIGIPQHFSEFTRLVYFNQELGGVTLTTLFGGLFLSCAGFFVVYFFVAYVRRWQARSVTQDILAVFLVFFLLLTFVFSRNKTLLGPLAAITLGESITAALASKKFKTVIIALIALMLLKTGFDAYMLVTTRYVNTKIDLMQRQALAAIEDRTPPNAVVMCYWADGYPIQTYCRRATTTDGLFESPEIVRRIIEESKAYYSFNEADLAALCAKYGVTHILVPTNRKMAYAGYANVYYPDYYRRGSATALAQSTVLYKLINEPAALAGFERLYANRDYILYAVKRSTP